MDDTNVLKRRLKETGLSDSAVEAAWPKWWSEEAQDSASARAELRFSIARKLGLDPHSLLEDSSAPRFLWSGTARFKHFSAKEAHEKSAITSFATAFSKLLLAAAAVPISLAGHSAISLRATLLKNANYIGLSDLLALCWGVGIPVVHLRVFPSLQKRMGAMAIRIGNRYAILLARDASYPAPLVFYLAHELAHILLGHLREQPAIVDFGRLTWERDGADPEEMAADRFALQLLTGAEEPSILSRHAGFGARDLAASAKAAAQDLRIEPGIIALCFGFTTKQWAVSTKALSYIYLQRKPVWKEVNRVALQNLELDALPEDARDYAEKILGIPDTL